MGIEFHSLLRALNSVKSDRIPSNDQHQFQSGDFLLLSFPRFCPRRELHSFVVRIEIEPVAFAPVLRDRGSRQYIAPDLTHEETNEDGESRTRGNISDDDKPYFSDIGSIKYFA
jgi:hypothetical protein